MASGGYHSNKQSKSDSVRRSNWQRSVSSDRDDAQSLNSLPSDVRINNWDLADLHPMNLGGDSKRRKKSKGNPEREREQSLSMDSPPRSGDLRHHSQTSFSRTKVNPNTPSSQKVSLENLKQQMMFGEYLDNGDGERNNERRIHQIRTRLHNASMNRTGPNSDLINQNNNVDTSIRDSAPDSKEIVTRLVQIRDFMKQARSMLESMERMGDRKKPEDVEKVRRLIQNLQDQEQGYKGLLQNTLIERQDDNARREGDDSLVARTEGKEEMDDSSVDLEVQTQNSETSDGSQDNSNRPRIEDKLGLGFEDDDDNQQGVAGSLLSAVGVNASSNNTLDQMEEAMASAFPVQETEEGAKGGVIVDGGSTTLDHQELVRILNEKQQQLQALMNRQEELNIKRREAEKRLMDAQARDNKARAALAAVASERELLQQFRLPVDGPPRQRDVGGGDQPQSEEKAISGEDGVLKSNIVGYPESDDEDNSNVREGNALPTELLELRRELNFLRNEFSQVNESPNNMETDTHLVEMGRQQLQNKLQELQNKKSSMDKLLHELQMLHAQPLIKLQRNNESSNPPPPSKSQSASNIPARPPPIVKPPLPNLPPPNSSLPLSLQAHMKEVASSAPNAVESAMATFSELAARGGDDQTAASMDSKSLEEVQDKLRRLKDVRSQLDQLRDLVEYYQGVKDQHTGGGGKTDEEIFVGDAEADNHLRNEAPRQIRTSSQNKSSESHMQQQQQQQPSHDFSQQQEHHQQNDTNTGASGGPQSSLLDLAQLLNLAGNENGDEHSDEDNASVSQSDSQWSNLGPWDDDPEIQEKVRKLKAAKEKLRHLQDLVAFVQQSPESGNALPQSLGDLAASVEGEAVSQATQTDEPNVSVSEGEVPMEEAQTRDDETSMDNAQAELQQLRKERARLMDLQSQLKHLQSVVNQGNDQQESSEARERRGEICDNEKTETEQAPNATVVTFASNDELYSKMRRQRILREELRSKKKELEAIMKKDRNKRQYSRNQDNQSDTVSLNTDTFGIPASVDATMATWGGSTVDNLENITEDEDGNADDQDDDGYPSDGIVQVEEEEEENDTDNGTYTIEADARQRKNMRKPGHMGIGARPKTSRGRQTFPQPAYTDQSGANKKVSKKAKRSVQSNQRESKIRQENYRSAEDLIQESEEDVKGKNGEWFRLMENRLNNLSSSVESLVKKLDSGGRQLSVSLSQENTSPTFVPPMQEQMLQLQNQSMMLSFSHIVQSLARQQGDMQQLQQQMQNLQIQIHDGTQDHSFQNMTGGAPPSSHLRPSVSTSALNNSSNFYPLSATVPPPLHPLASPYPQMNLNNSMSGNLMTHGPFGQTSGMPGSHLGSLHNTFPTGASNLGSNFSLHQQNANVSSNSFAQGGRDVGQQMANQHQHQNASHTQQLDSAVAGGSQYPNLFHTSQQTQEREEQEESSLERMNAYMVDKKGESDSWAKKYEYDYSSSQGLHMSTPKLENLEAERRRQPNDKGRRGPIGRENSSDLSMFAPLYGSTSGLDDVAGGDNTDGIAKLHLSSSYSSIQSIKDEHSRIKQEQGQPKSGNTDEESNSLFESLRDTIYTEVASFISQNENRPHFLLELFREIRQVDSDLLRQRTLYSVQELVNNYLKSSPASASSHKPAWLNTPLSTQETANSDQTPSESVITSEDDEDPHVSRLQQASDPCERNARSKLPKFPFDYRKSVEDFSSMSTPSNVEEAPFFQDALGETVIEFDSLRKRERKLEGKPKLGEGAFLASEHILRDMLSRPVRRESKQKASGDSGKRQIEHELVYGEGANNSVDQASESSMSDMPYPRIDMKQLDLQIKQVMMETIPVVKEHMEDICSSQLLAYIKRLVLSLTAQTGGQEFARFFHRQLSSILQDTLEKYEGRKMRECGEDLLVEISDVLFNELAFFRLMQDIEDPNEVERLRGTTAHTYQGRRVDERDDDGDNDEEDSNFNEDEEVGAEEEKDGREKASAKTTQRGFHITEAEQEQLGRERDDELANEMIQDGDDQDEDDDTEHSYKIELAPSETKPFTRIGSDEDDDNSDEERSVEDLSETAVSRNDAKMETPTSVGSQQPANGTNNGPPPVRPETEGAWGEGDKEKLDIDKPVSPSKLAVLNGDNANRSPSHPSPQMNGSVNGGAVGNHTDDDENQELTVDDLPERLTVGSSCDTATVPSSTTNSI